MWRFNPVMGSRLVDVSYSDTSPERAQRVANGYADAFMAANLDKRFQANASAKTFLEDKIQQLKLRLEESEKRLLAFAQDQQIVDVNDKTSIAETNLASANAALGNLIAERTKNEQLWRQTEAGKEIDLPQLLVGQVHRRPARQAQGARHRISSRSCKSSSRTTRRWFKSRISWMKSIANSPDEAQTIKEFSEGRLRGLVWRKKRRCESASRP